MSLRTQSRPLLSAGLQPHLYGAASRLAGRQQHSFSPRWFLSVPGVPDTQHLAAARTLPYSRDSLYGLIADVDSYASFVPYCSLSRVTQWSRADGPGARRLPALADLRVGWGGFTEDFTSRLRCVPGVSVEAVSGGPDADASAVFKTLTTRWSLKSVADAPAERPSTQVHLDIKYQFTNPLYAAVSAAMSEKMASKMIAAFEEQARKVLGDPSKSSSDLT